MDSSLHFACLNVQGLCWYRFHCRDKLQALISMARQMEVDVMCLSDVHTDGTGVTTVYIEEYTIVFGYRSAILLSHRARRAWQQGGGKSWTSNDRFLAISIPTTYRTYVFCSVYLPAGSQLVRHISKYAFW